MWTRQAGAEEAEPAREERGKEKKKQQEQDGEKLAQERDLAENLAGKLVGTAAGLPGQNAQRGRSRLSEITPGHCEREGGRRGMRREEEGEKRRWQETGTNEGDPDWPVLSAPPCSPAEGKRFRAPHHFGSV